RGSRRRRCRSRSSGTSRVLSIGIRRHHHIHIPQPEPRILQAPARTAQRLPDKARHHKRRRLRRRRHQKTDLRRRHLRLFRRRTLRQHLIRRYPGLLHLGHRIHIQPAPPDIQFRRMFALSRNIRNRHPHLSQTLRHSHLPPAPHLCSRQRQLRHDSPLRNLRTVVLALDRNLQPESRRCPLRFRRSQPHQRRHRDLLPMNGKPHRGQCRHHRHYHQHQRQHRKSDCRFHIWKSPRQTQSAEL